jgi:hypothetical protein
LRGNLHFSQSPVKIAQTPAIANRTGQAYIS